MLYHSPSFRRALASSLSLLALVPAHAAFAQESPAPATGNEPVEESLGDDLHDRRLDTQGVIVVSAKGLRELDLLAGVTVLESSALQANMQGQLGEVLAKLPGVTASGFAPGASRPVLRGFSGERVRVLVDGIGAIDASNTSADHAVSIDPLTAESMEVLRGPAVLLYGSQAIGGAVNVIDKRIPRRLPGEHAHIDALMRADTATDLREAGASVDMPLGGGFVAHADGSWRETGDLEVPGFVNSRTLRADLLAAAAEEDGEGHPDEAGELRDLANLHGSVPNTGTKTYTANGGLAFFRGDSSLGVAIGLYDTNYGIPLRPGAGHIHGADGADEAVESEGEESVSIDLRQIRADLRADIVLGEGFFEHLRVRAGYSDYTHTEFEGDEVGTVFDVSGMEARVELSQGERGVLRGTWGLQYHFRDFEAVGAEAYVAPNRTEQLAAFVLQEYGNGPVQLEGAVRYEKTRVDSAPLGKERDFGTMSGALGVTYQPTSRIRTGVNLTRVARAPSAEEMFANGPHIATQAFEIGDPDLSVERAWGIELFARGHAAGIEFNIAAYRNWFDNYIYQSETGEGEDGLPVFAYLQTDATYTGFEGELNVPLLAGNVWKLGADLRASYVEAELSDGSPVPRIPSLGLAGALEGKSDRVDARAELEWYDRQNRVAAFETPTAGFAMVNAAVTWRPFRERDSVQLMLKADNIFDAVGRRHASFTKEFVPLSGRNISASVRLSF